MSWNMLNHIPVIGHIKGAYHYVKGDEEKGDLAILQSSRTSVITLCGVVGSLAGPVGIAAGGAIGGTLGDAACSIGSGTPKGVIADVADMADDIENGDLPVKPAVNLALNLYNDATTAGMALNVVKTIKDRVDS